jgi:DMSO/TMAO reductase YedYZ molybdopterin-dependent catalytic subunit
MRVRTGTNGEQLPLVIGFPLPLVFAPWYATYWVKMPSDIEVLDQPDTNYWTKVAYTIPDSPHVSIKLGKTDVEDDSDQPDRSQILRHEHCVRHALKGAK